MKITETPLLVKTHDFNVWLLSHSRRFPKHFRYSLTQRLETLALEFEEAIIKANALRAGKRKEMIEHADGLLQCLKTQMRYTEDFQLLSSRQLIFAIESLEELGRLLGAWLRGTSR